MVAAGAISPTYGLPRGPRARRRNERGHISRELDDIFRSQAFVFDYGSDGLEGSVRPPKNRCQGGRGRTEGELWPGC